MTSPNPHRAFLESRYFGALDGLRAISILAVVWHHAGHRSTGILSRGHLGVELFFAISGFLITTLLLREADQNGQVSLKNFYVRRTLRIFPLYYAVVGLYAALVLVVERGSAPGQQFFANLPFFLTYTSNWFVDLGSGSRVIFYFAWSLATEEQFYLLWPWAVRFARRWHQPVLFMASLLVADLAAEWAVREGLLDGGRLWVRVLTSVATPICLGCLSAYLLHRERGFAFAYRLFGRPWSAPAWALLLVALVSIDGAPRLAVYLAMAGLVAATCIRPDHVLVPVLANRAVRYIGSVSYGMYLLHMFALNGARRLVPGAPDLVTFVLAAAMALGFAAISHRWFETPFLNLKHRFRTPRTKTASPTLGLGS